MRVFRFSVIAVSCFLAVIIFHLVSTPESQAKRLPPLPQDAHIQVYFNHNAAEGADYTDPYRNITRSGDNLEEIMVKAIASAQKSVDLAVQELRLPKIATALAERQQSGIPVRVILENNYSRPVSSITPAEIAQFSERERNRHEEIQALIDINRDGQLSAEEIRQRDALVMINNAGIPWLDDTADGSQGSGLMHHKFAVIDGNTVIVSSANLTPSDVHGDLLKPDTRGNANNLVTLESPEIASLFTEEFNIMWGDGPGGLSDSQFGLNKPIRSPQTLKLGNSSVTVQFSPISPTQPWETSSNGFIGKLLSEATKSVHLALFVFSEQGITNTLETVHSQGVEIKALIDPSFAFRYYSEGLDMLGVALRNNCAHDPNNRPWDTPISTVGTPQLPWGDLLHHKYGVIDDKTVITGSHNWSAAANHTNDETVLVLENPVIAAHYTREFERLYTNANLGLPQRIQERIAEEERTCPPIPKASISPSSELVNLNSATQEELETLPGIGPKLAERIIETRQQQPFSSLEDLERVSGIGANLVKNLEGQVIW